MRYALTNMRPQEGKWNSRETGTGAETENGNGNLQNLLLFTIVEHLAG